MFFSSDPTLIPGNNEIVYGNFFLAKLAKVLSSIVLKKIVYVVPNANLKNLDF